MPIDNFPAFSKIVNASFKAMCVGEIFATKADGDALYEGYIASFPAGTNPMFKNRTEHECSCCKQFVRNVANVVAFDKDGNRVTVWDEAAKKAPEPYATVAKALRKRVIDSPIVGIFRTKEGFYGSQQTRSLDKGSGTVLTWNHFYTAEIDKKFRPSLPDKACGDYATTVAVFERGLKELSTEALESVVGLIDANALYRGAEHRAAVTEFLSVQKKFAGLEGRAAADFVWREGKSPAARFRNTVIGTLIQDLSEGKELEAAVAAFEKKVAPENYKRTTALITPGMVKKAMETIQALGLEPALERRFARIEDVSVKDLLWVDSSVAPLTKGGLGDVLMSAAKANTKDVVGEAQSIGWSDFVKEVLPTATGVEVLFKGEHLKNLMSITAPKHPEPKQLFKWDNDFAFSYVGNLADSDMRKAVQARGGRVDGVFRFTHQWNHDKCNASLMDLHVFMPGSGVSPENGVDDNYGRGPRVGWNARSEPRSGGVQDVDYTDPAPEGYIPVENITFPDIRKMPEGRYVCKIHNWRLRLPTDGGFRAEIEFGGRVFQYEYPKPLKHKEWVTVAEVELKDGAFTIKHHLPCGSAPQEKWGLRTEQFVKANAVLLSPNYWGNNAVGNKHALFVLDGCKNDEPTRGIYNEFLHPRLMEHRKVFEVIGDKTKCQPTNGQLSGLGFSSTKDETVTVRIRQGSKQRLYAVKTGA